MLEEMSADAKAYASTAAGDEIGLSCQIGDIGGWVKGVARRHCAVCEFWLETAVSYELTHSVPGELTSRTANCVGIDMRPETDRCDDRNISL